MIITLKKITAMLMALVLMVCMIPVSGIADRGSNAFPYVDSTITIAQLIARAKVIRGYTYAQGNTVGYNGTGKSTGKKGTVFASDYIKIVGISRDNQWTQVSWPVDGTGGWKTGYVPSTAVFPKPNEKLTAKTAVADSNTYVYRNGRMEWIGYIERGDTVYTTSSTRLNGYVLVFYTLNGGGYKMGWAWPGSY